MAIIDALRTSRATAEQIRRRGTTGGLDTTIKDKPQPGCPRTCAFPVAKQRRHGSRHCYCCLRTSSFAAGIHGAG